jgi:hypothetical protein
LPLQTKINRNTNENQPDLKNTNEPKSQLPTKNTNEPKSHKSKKINQDLNLALRDRVVSVKGPLGAPPVLLQSLSFLGENRSRVAHGGGSGVVLGGEDVAWYASHG